VNQCRPEKAEAQASAFLKPFGFHVLGEIPCNRDITRSIAHLAGDHDLAVVLNRHRGKERDVRAVKAGGNPPPLPNVVSSCPPLLYRANAKLDVNWLCLLGDGDVAKRFFVAPKPVLTIFTLYNKVLSRRRPQGLDADDGNRRRGS